MGYAKLVILYDSGNSVELPTPSSEAKKLRELHENVLNVVSVQIVTISKDEYWSIINRQREEAIKSAY